MFSRSFVLIFYTCLQCLDKHTWLPRSRLIWGWVIEWVGYKIFIGKEISDSNITIRRKVPKFIFNIHRCVAICMKMIRKVLLEDCIMFFFFLVFSHTGREKKSLQKSLGLICFFLAVENYMKYYQQAAKSHKAIITFQDVSQDSTTPGRDSPCLVTICRFCATFITLFW